MATRTAEAEWRGNLRDGQRRTKPGSGAFDGAYSFPSRFESGQGSEDQSHSAARAGVMDGERP